MPSKEFSDLNPYAESLEDAERKAIDKAGGNEVMGSPRNGWFWQKEQWRAAGKSPKGTTGQWRPYTGFDNTAAVYHTKEYGAVTVHGGIGQFYDKFEKNLFGGGGSESSLGFPTSNEYQWWGGYRQDFERKYIFWYKDKAEVEEFGKEPSKHGDIGVGDASSKKLGTVEPDPRFKEVFSKFGGSDKLGTPTNFVYDSRGGYLVQDFQGGSEGGASLIIKDQASTLGFSGKVNTDNLKVRINFYPNANQPTDGFPKQFNSGENLIFDQVKEGGEYPANGKQSKLWYRIAGTSYWVAGAYISGNLPETLKIQPKTSEDNSLKIDWDFISLQEGGRQLTGYVPQLKIKHQSGVTIATGFDLGQHNKQELQNMELPNNIIQKLEPYLGLQLKDAENALKKQELTITEEEGQIIDKAVKKKQQEELEKSYNNDSKINFRDLSGEAQTVIASVTFQKGKLSIVWKKFWSAVIQQNWSEAVKVLQNAKDGYTDRRNAEANYLKSLLQ